MLSITLRPSYLLALMLAAMHALALISVWLVPLPLTAKIGAAVVLMLSLVLTLRRHVWRTGKQAIRAIRLSGECDVAVQGQDSEWQEVVLLPSSFVSDYLTVLNLRLEGEKLARHVVILPDAIDAEQFRQMRVWLRWKCGKKE
jgi:toxin CptA